MLRNFDWLCVECGARKGDLIEIPQGTLPADWPHFATLHCARCGHEAEHERVISRTAHYTRAKITAQITGGTYDTMGYGRMTPYPKPPEFESYAHFKDWVHTPEYQEAKSKRAKEREQNEAKRARAKLMKAGADIDLRVDKLPGDHPFIRE